MYMPCLVATQPGHYAKNHMSTHLGLRAQSAGDHEADRLLSVSQESESEGHTAIRPSDSRLTHTRGRKGRRG